METVNAFLNAPQFDAFCDNATLLRAGTIALYAGAAGIAVSFVTMMLGSVLGMSPSGPVFRDRSHPLMSFYLPFVSPFVHAFLITMFVEILNIKISGAPDALTAGAVFGVLHWLTSAFQGLIMDYACYRSSLKLLIWFWLCSLIQSVTVSSVIFFYRA